jgi:superfamily II DNA/RNA helicase
MSSNFGRRDLVLVFVARKQTCDIVANMLSRKGYPAAALHGDKDQAVREKTLATSRGCERQIYE